MKKLFFSFLMLVAANAIAVDVKYWKQSAANNATPVQHAAWNGILKAHIVERDGINLFNYQALLNDKSATGIDELRKYVSYLEGIKVISLTPDEQMAYWINLYNATTVREIADNYPVDSIRDISSGFFSRGPWKKDLVKVEGRKLSLDNIEHGILRPIFKDSRIHYAVNCASIGCPNLQIEAFTASNLQALLDDAARQYVNHPRAVRVKGKDLKLSSIYDWYSEDFGSKDAKVIEHLKKYAAPELRQQLEAIKRVDDYGYDWKLNEVK